MGATGSSVLGAVEVEVKANLNQLTADFARGKQQAQAFARDMSGGIASQAKATERSLAGVNAQARGYAANMVTFNKAARDIDDQNVRRTQAWGNVQKVMQANTDTINTMTRATNPLIASQRLVTSALRDAETQYRNGAITSATLARAQQMAAPWLRKNADEVTNLTNRLAPLALAHTRYKDDLGKIAALEQAGTVTSARANEMRAISAGRLARVEHQTDRLSNSLVGSARAFEHHVRAFRLLYGYIGGAVIGTLAQFALKTIESTAAIANQAQALGVTTKELQEYRAIAGQVGMTTADMDSALGTFGKNIDDLRLGRISPFSKMLKIMKIDLNDAGGAAKTNGQLFGEVIGKLGKVGDESQRRGGQVIAFGSAGEKMGEMVAKGSEGVEQLRKAVEATGMVLSDEQIQKADETAKKLNQVKEVLAAKIASVVVENAGAISDLADAFSALVSVGLPNLVNSVAAFAARMHDLANGLLEVKKAAGFISDLGTQGLPQAQRPSSLFGKIMRSGFDMKTRNFGTYDEHGNFTSFQDLESLRRGPNPQASVTVSLPPATPAAKKPKGIDLSGLLSPKGPKARRGPKDKYDEFERDMAQEKERQLQLERDATGDLERQNQIDNELIDLKLKERIEQINKQVHSKSLTAAEGKKLKSEAEITAGMEKEAAARKMRIADIERGAHFADEIARLEDDALGVARVMARTDDERKKIDLAILDSKQRQVVQELKTEIALAEQAHDEQRVLELTEELVRVRANQLGELKAFDIEHLTGIDKFKNDLPRTQKEIGEAIKNLKFDLFNQKLQQAAQFADDIGGAFGRAAGDLARLHNPLDVLRNLVSDLAETFTKNFIEKPISDWAKDHVGLPLAKQGFGKELTKMGGLDAEQLNVALGQATGSVSALAGAAGPAGPALTTITTAAAPLTAALTSLTAAATAAAAALQAQAAAGALGGGGDGGFGGLLDSVLGGGGAGGGGLFSIIGGGDPILGGLDLGGGPLGGGMFDITFADGGFTGSGADHEIAGGVHKNEWVWDAPTTRQYRPLLQMMSEGRMPNFQGPGLGAMIQPQRGGGDRHFHFGDVIVPGVKDERSARRSGNQVVGVIQRRIADANRKGLNK